MKIELFGGRITAKKAVNIGSFIKKEGKNYAELSTKQHINARFIQSNKKIINKVHIVTDNFDNLIADNLLASFSLARKMKKQLLGFDKKISISISGNKINRCNLFKNEVCFALAKKHNILGYNLYLFGTKQKDAKQSNIFLKSESEVLDIVKTIRKIMQSYKVKRFYKLEEQLNINNMTKLIKQLSKNDYAESGKTLIENEYKKQKKIINLKNNLFAVKVIFPNGIISGDDLTNLAQKVEKFGNSCMVVDREQNIYALGIKGVGEALATNLARHFNNLSALLVADAKTLLTIDDLGETLSKKYVVSLKILQLDFAGKFKPT